MAKPLLDHEGHSENVKVGDEVKFIDLWEECANEIEELKKIFFEFLQRWINNDNRTYEVNRPVLYERQQDED